MEVSSVGVVVVVVVLIVVAVSLLFFIHSTFCIVHSGKMVGTNLASFHILLDSIVSLRHLNVFE